MLEVVMVGLSFLVFVAALFTVSRKPNDDSADVNVLGKWSKLLVQMRADLEDASAPTQTAPASTPGQFQTTSREMTPSERRASFLSYFRDWFSIATQIQQPNVWSRDIQTYMAALENRKAAEGTNQFESSDPDYATTVRKAAKEALIRSDKDLDPTRGQSELQEALFKVIDTAGLKLIDPGRGSTYPPRSTGNERAGGSRNPVPRKVGKVLTRGLRRRSTGEVLMEPEIQEAG